MSHQLARRTRVATAVAVGAVVLAACGSPQDAAPPGDPVAEPSAGVHVVATTSILGDIVGELVADDGEVSVIMPPGADPHSFQASAADAALLRDATMVVAIGLDLEEALVSMLESAREDGAHVLEIAEHLDPIEFGASAGGPHAHDDSHLEDHALEDDHAHGPEDPHVWFDPIRMADAVGLIARELDGVAPSEAWAARADAYVTELLAVHDDLVAIFDEIPEERRVLVTNHDALGYLAHRYGFQVLGTVIPGSSTQAEADPRSFSRLITVVEQARVPAVFAENTDSTRLAEQLASEVGRSDLQLEVVRLYTDALGPHGSGAETYLGLLRTNAQLIADALR